MNTELLGDWGIFRVLQVIGSYSVTRKRVHKSVTVREIAGSLGITPHEVFIIATRLWKGGLVIGSFNGRQRIATRRFTVTSAGERCLPRPLSG